MIRPYEASDKEAVLSIWRDANALAHPFLSPERVIQAETMIRDTFLDMAETWISAPAGTPAGFISLLGEEVGGLFILPAWQGRGLGRLLLDTACASRPRLELDVFAANTRAQRFYRRYGFTEARRQVNPFFGHAEIRMTLDPR
ncbi:GNAT family N-acetyltransferase [Leisingera sp.]|uniref:GNAT family N-acetyltransferase n=1 Tax=Leisingera sp. TaxID=1879318 RepID=UPI002B268647|nr:GNAT family N-acetyltransferase [Leisingera sp.]